MAPLWSRRGYEVRGVCGANARRLARQRTGGLIEIRTPYGMDRLDGSGPRRRSGNSSVPGITRTHKQFSALQARSQQRARVVAAMCVGAFTLGLLPACWTGRRATTHWQLGPASWRGGIRTPTSTPVFCSFDEGPVLDVGRSGHRALDMCLHLIRQHAGPDLAGRTARRVVVPAVARRWPGAVHRARRARRR